MEKLRIENNGEKIGQKFYSPECDGCTSIEIAQHHLVLLLHWNSNYRKKSEGKFIVDEKPHTFFVLTWQHWNTNPTVSLDCDNVSSDKQTVPLYRQFSNRLKWSMFASQSICHRYPNQSGIKWVKIIFSSIEITHEKLTAMNDSSKNSPLIPLPRFDIKCSQNDQANWSPSRGFVLRYNSSIITKLFAVTFFKMCSVIFTSSTNDEAFFSIESFEPIRVKIRSVTRISALLAGM